MPQGDSWQGYSPGITVEPGKDAKGKPDPCRSIITVNFWLDGAASIKNGCLPNYFSSYPGDLEGVDLDVLFSEARSILEGKRFACPCKKPPGKKCWLEFRIKVHKSPEGDEDGGATPVPIELNCNCKKKRIGGELYHGPRPGYYVHGPHRMHICLPILPTSPHTVAHEVMHALGLGLNTDMYDRNGRPLRGWEGTLMGDAHGTDVTERDICKIAAANRACQVPKKNGKAKQCCVSYSSTVFAKPGGKVKRAEVVPVATAPTPERNYMLLQSLAAPVVSVPSGSSQPWGGLTLQASEEF